MAKLEKYQDQKGNYMNVTNDTGSQVSVFDKKGNATIKITIKVILQKKINLALLLGNSPTTLPV